MTGNQIRKLRTELDLSVMEFASLTGVQLSSVYRWEKEGNKAVAVEGLPRQIFQMLHSLKQKERTRIVQRLRNGGWMAALHSLLGISIKKAA